MLLTFLPFPVTRAITQTVEEFAEKHEAEVLSWYHDEPVWFVRQAESADPRDRTNDQVVRRIQVSAFEPSSPQELPQLHILPDSYAHGRLIEDEPIKEFKRLREASWVKKNSRIMDVYLENGEPISTRELRETLWVHLKECRDALREHTL